MNGKRTDIDLYRVRGQCDGPSRQVASRRNSTHAIMSSPTGPSGNPQEFNTNEMIGAPVVGAGPVAPAEAATDLQPARDASNFSEPFAERLRAAIARQADAVEQNIEKCASCHARIRQNL